MRILVISDVHNRVLEIKRDIANGYSVKDACVRNRYTIKAYYSDIDYLNKNGFNYIKEK